MKFDVFISCQNGWIKKQIVNWHETYQSFIVICYMKLPYFPYSLKTIKSCSLSYDRKMQWLLLIIIKYKVDINFPTKAYLCSETKFRFYCTQGWLALFFAYIYRNEKNVFQVSFYIIILSHWFISYLVTFNLASLFSLTFYLSSEQVAQFLRFN